MNLSAALLVLLPLSTLTVGCGAESPDGGALQDGGADVPDHDPRCLAILLQDNSHSRPWVVSMRWVGPATLRCPATLADCEFTCTPDLFTCPPNRQRGIPGVCDTSIWDSDNCGGCGIVCRVGQRCRNPGDFRNPSPVPVCAPE